MNLNPKKWLNTLPNVNIETNQEEYKLDNQRWIDTLHKRKKDNSIQKYSLVTILFVVGLIFVSVIKNETRNLQKEIDKLEATINIIKFDLHQTTLDHEVITSPENISRLAKEYLESNLVVYKKSQIKQIGREEIFFTKPENVKIKKNLEQKTKDNKNKIKLIFAKKIETKKIELAKLKELYYKPKDIPKKLKLKITKKVKKKKNELLQLRKIYSDPKSILASNKAQRWAAFQVVKVFLGIPIVPGK